MKKFNIIGVLVFVVLFVFSAKGNVIYGVACDTGCVGGVWDDCASMDQTPPFACHGGYVDQKCQWYPNNPPGCSSGSCNSASCSGGGGGTDRYKALGPLIKFLVYPTVASVPSWPVTGKTAVASWVEESVSGSCAGSLTQPLIEVRMIVTGHGSSSNPVYVGNASIDPDYPSCSNGYSNGESMVRAIIKREKIGQTPIWYPRTTHINLPASSLYRQFGIKITDGSRIAYMDRYVWENNVNETDGIGCCDLNQPDGFRTFNGAPSKDFSYYKDGVLCEPNKSCRRLRTIKSPSRSAWAVATYYNDGNECDGNKSIHMCPSGYTPAPAVTEVTGECGGGSSFMGTDRYNVFTCKKVVNGVNLGNWKPEAGSLPINVDPSNWWAGTQNRRLYQDFTFTVDRTGNYYFTRCPSGDCTATMTINGSWDGWYDHTYTAGTTYSARFECTWGNCYYGLGVGPRSSSMLADITAAQTSNSVWVPLVYKVPPSGTLSIYPRDIGSTAATCATVRAGLSSVGITASVNGTARVLASSWSLPYGSIYPVSITSVPASYVSGNYVFCQGTSGETRNVGSTVSMTVGIGTTTSLYVGVVRRGSLNVMARGVAVSSPTCAQVVGGTSLSGAGAGASITGYASRALNYVFGNLVPGNYTVTGTSAPVGYAGYYLCSSTAGSPVMTSRSITVGSGTTASMYVGYVQGGSLNVISKGLGSAPTNCAQVSGASNINGSRVTVTGTGYSSTQTLNPNYVFGSLAPNDYTVTGVSAPTGYAGYYLCTSTGAGVTPTMNAKIATVTSGSTATMYVGVVTNPTISGTIFDASDREECSIMSPPIQGATVSWGGYSATTNASGFYSMTVPTGTNVLSVNAPGYNGIKLSCNGAVGNLTMSPGVNVTRSFGFWGELDGWFQVSGDLYAGGGVNETIPSSCIEPTCQPYLIKADSYGTGLARIKTGSFSLGSGLVSSSGYQAVSGPSPGTKIYDYDYYKVKMSKFNKSEWSSYPSISYSPASGDDYMLLTRTGNVTFDSNPNVGAGQKIVFLIDGDVTINSNMSVASGGYLAIIANGTITFSSNVTNAQGVFVADSISILSNNSGLHDDVLFTGQGSFIGYNSITMTRDRGVTNNTAPAETFSFRPDFVISSPLPMMTKDSTWREVVPR